MGQELLFKQEEKKVVLTEKKEIVNTEKDTYEYDTNHKELDEMISRCKKEDEPYSYALVKYNCKSNLEGKKEWITINDCLERRYKELGSWSGCGDWVTLETKEDIDKLFSQLLDLKKRYCRKPYTSESCVNKGGGEDLFLTDVNIKNTLVVFEEKSKDFLEKIGFPIEEFFKEFNELEQKQATKEDIRKSKTFELMEKQVDKLQNECWTIKGYFEECEFLIKRKGNYKRYYTKKIEELGIETDLNKLRELYNKKAKQYQVFYSKIYFQRFGKMSEEEYTYP